MRPFAFCHVLPALLVAGLTVALTPAAAAQAPAESSSAAPSPVGQWRTIDDETGQPKAVVEIYEEEDGRLYGRIVEVLQAGDEAVTNDAGQIICHVCEGARANQPVEGMVIIEDMERDGDEWEGGTILDPANGKTYKAKMELDGANTLDVRGYIGIPLLGRTQTWHRVPPGETAAGT